MNMKDQIALVELMIEPLLSIESYINAMEEEITSEAMQIDMEKKYQMWLSKYRKALKHIYTDRVKADDLDALAFSFNEWTRLKFFILDYNHKMKKTTDFEIDAMINS